MGMRHFVAGLAFFAIFAIVIVSYAIGFAEDNDAAIDLSDDTNLVSLNQGGDVEDDIDDFETDSDDSKSLFGASTIAQGDDNIEGGTPFKTGPIALTTAAGTILSSSTNRIFGEDSQFSFIIRSILAFLALLIVYYGWKLWKGGSPD